MQNEVIIRFAKAEDLVELFSVYENNYPNNELTLDFFKQYLEKIPKSILIGLVNNKIVAHLFCHPMNIDNYENCHIWNSYDYFNKDGKYLYIWGAGILKEYRTNFNFSWAVQNKQIEYNLQTYKNIQKSILTTVTHNKKLYRWHLLAGYEPVYVKNNIITKSGETIHLCILEFNLKQHIVEFGYEKLKRIYGFVNTGIIPKYIEE